MQEIVHDVWRQVFAAQFKENLHCFKVPFVSGRKSLAEFSDFKHKGVSEVLISGAMESLHHFADNNFDIFIGGHTIKQIKSFLLESFVLGLKTFHDDELVVFEELGMVFMSLNEEPEPHVFEIVVAGTGKELGKTSSCLGNKFFIGVNCENGFDALVGNGKGNVVAGFVSTFERLFDNGVTVFRCFGVTFPQKFKDFEKFHLDPRGGHSVVVEFFWQFVLDDLFEDNHERGCQLPVLFWVFLDLFVVKIQGG
jgi:hypothetical protein